MLDYVLKSYNKRTSIHIQENDTPITSSLREYFLGVTNTSAWK